MIEIVCETKRVSNLFWMKFFFFIYFILVHCWDYRRYVARQCKVPLKEEFEFTTKKIEENFSNYSAWHQRSAILPSLFSTNDELISALLLEFELVQNAFYTEPSDQSAWFYLRWLITKSN